MQKINADLVRELEDYAILILDDAGNVKTWNKEEQRQLIPQQALSEAQHKVNPCHYESLHHRIET